MCWKKSERIGNMPNKLKDIFSDRMFDLGGKLHFDDNESYKKFLEALQIVQDEGRSVKVEGVSSVTTEIRDGEIEYLYLEDINPTEFIIAPSVEDVPIVLDTEYGKKTVVFRRYYTTHEVILETGKNEIVYLKIVFIKNTSKITLTYKTQPQLAKTIKNIVESFGIAIALLNTIFVHKEDQNSNDEDVFIQTMRKSIMKFESFFKRLYLVEQEFGLLIDPSQISDTENDQREIEELYLLFIEKKVIRLNAKLNATDSTEITIANKLKVGSSIDITYVQESEYSFYGQKISIHTVNLLSNAIIKEIKESEEGKTKLLYGDTDNRPMYISYTGYKTTDEAKQEMRAIMKHKEKYIDALTLNEHMQMISEK